MSEALLPPYYLDREGFDYLESEISILPPSLVDGYRDVEKTASMAFLHQFGTYLSVAQRNYFSQTQLLFTTGETANYLDEQWDEGIHTLDGSDSTIEGLEYFDYALEKPGQDEHLTETDHFDKIRQFWGGRMAVFPLAEIDVIAVDSSQLIDTLAAPELDDVLSCIHSNAVAGIAVHEKVHGVQDWRLPLPILEAAAHYYEHTVACYQGWYDQTPSEMLPIVDLYADCIREFGDEVHALTFGNLDEARRAELLPQLKGRFNPKKINEVSRAKDGSLQVYWTIQLGAP